MFIVNWLLLTKIEEIFKLEIVVCITLLKSGYQNK